MNSTGETNYLEDEEKNGQVHLCEVSLDVCRKCDNAAGTLAALAGRRGKCDTVPRIVRFYLGVLSLVRLSRSFVLASSPTSVPPSGSPSSVYIDPATTLVRLLFFFVR
jgi:hypothetical protein